LTYFYREVADSLNNLANLYMAMGSYDRAEEQSRKALEIRRSALGEEHLDVAQSLSALSETRLMAGDEAQAEMFCRQALEIFRLNLGKDHPRVANSLNNLAALAQYKG